MEREIIIKKQRKRKENKADSHKNKQTDECINKGRKKEIKLTKRNGKLGNIICSYTN
jgi:hypothetical protein